MWLYASCVLMHVVMWCCMITTLYAYVHLSSGSLVIHELGEFLIRLRVCWAESPLAGSQCCCAMLGAMIWCAVYLRFTHSAWSWRLLIYLFQVLPAGAAWAACDCDVSFSGVDPMDPQHYFHEYCVDWVGFTLVGFWMVFIYVLTRGFLLINMF